LVAACNPDGATPLPTTPAACAAPTPVPVTGVAPIADCVIRATAGGPPLGYVWGYSNGGAETQSIPLGATNQFIGTGPSQGQPVVFEPGEHRGVFHTGIDASTWMLGASVLSAASARTCTPTWSGNTESVRVGRTILDLVPDTSAAIVPTPVDANGDAVAELPGDLAVTVDGAASYTVPLRVPDGLGGMQPRLALAYSSRGGDGLLGVGWSLGGLSQVSRCPKNLAAEGLAADIHFDSTDQFCLDGEHLRQVGSANGGIDYRPENSPFLRVVALNPDALGPTEFDVYEPSGRIRRYGRDAVSTLQGTIVAVSADPNSWTATPTEDLSHTGRLTWFLRSEEDRFGNKSIWEYANNQTCPTASATPCEPAYEVYPTQIRYTAAKGSNTTTRSVRFVYDSNRLGAPDFVPATAPSVTMWRKFGRIRDEPTSS
jgi:hypothetical protein